MLYDLNLHWDILKLHRFTLELIPIILLVVNDLNLHRNALILIIFYILNLHWSILISMLVVGWSQRVNLLLTLGIIVTFDVESLYFLLIGLARIVFFLPKTFTVFVHNDLSYVVMIFLLKYLEQLILGMLIIHNLISSIRIFIFY